MNGRQQDAHELILKMLEVGPQHKSEWQNNFEGWLKQEITCKKCWNTSTSRSLAFYDLNLALSDHNNFVDALSGHFDAEDVDIFCNSCKTLERSTKTQKIIRPPRIFFIQIKKFRQWWQERWKENESPNRFPIRKLQLWPDGHHQPYWHFEQWPLLGGSSPWRKFLRMQRRSRKEN